MSPFGYFSSILQGHAQRSQCAHVSMLKAGAQAVRENGCLTGARYRRINLIPEM